MANSIRHHIGLMVTAAALAPVLCMQTAPAKARIKSSPKQPQPAAAVRDHFDENAPDGTRITYQAGAVYLANQLHDQAHATPNPAKALDDILDALPETMPKVFAEMGTAPDLAAVLLPEVTGRVWAFSVVAHARAEVGEGYEYVFDILADNVRHGRDPREVRAEVPRVVEKLHAIRITARLREARDAADGPWAEFLDLVLETIEEGADPQAVINQALALMRQARAGKAGGGK